MNRTFSVAGALCVILLAIGCGSKSPTPMTPTPTPTKIIRLTGNMNFGRIQIGSSSTAVLTIHNDGNTTLNTIGIFGDNGILAVLITTGAVGQVPAGGQVDVQVTFSPTNSITYSGTLTVQGDHTGGTNTIAFTGTGSLDGVPIFTRSGVGNAVFDMPLYVNQLHVVGTFTGQSQTFTVLVGPKGNTCGVSFDPAICRAIVSDILGTFVGRTTYDNTVQTGGGGTVSVALSTGVSWTMTEVR
jgi:HYDIN/CFA65/VesB-like, Ig-like domain